MATSENIEPLTLAWNDINVAFTTSRSLLDRYRGKDTTRKTVLNGVSGLAEPGRLTALMGPSGAGKTTLMNVLTQRNLGGMDIEGSVMLNGVPVNRIRSFNKTVGFIQQYDVLPGALTVREHLNFTTSLLYRTSLNREQRAAKVQTVITQVSLGKCADTMIGGEMTFETISGGERKRCCIAAQLLSNPGVLILDEPTTGMDSYIASLLMEILHDLATTGYTILCTVHQPSSGDFNQIDRLDLLADGRTAYAGSRDDAVEYFGRQGFQCPVTFLPADYFINILIRKPGQEDQTTKTIQFLCDRFEQSPEATDIYRKVDRQVGLGKSDNSLEDLTATIEKSNMSGASITAQFFLLLNRERKGIIRQPKRLIAQIFTGLVMTFFMTSLFWNPDSPLNQRFASNSFGLLVIIVSFVSGGLNVLGMIEGMLSMLPLVVKESRDGIYKPQVYYASAILTESVFVNIGILICFFPVYYSAGLDHNQDDFATPVKILVICMLASVIAVGLCAVLVFVGGKMEVCIDLVMTLYFFFFVLSGYFKNLRSIDNPLLTVFNWFNYLAWTMEWTSLVQWKGVKNIECEYAGTKAEDICLSRGEEVIYKNGYEDHPWKDFALLIGQLVFYNVLALSLFLIKLRRKFAG